MTIGHSSRHRQEGFTLIELMLAIALVGVVAVFAVMSYNSVTYKGKIATAKSDIFSMSAQIGNYYATHDAYPATLADAGLASQLDPWGRPYQYYNVDANGKGGSRKDHALNPINSDFDLYSMGKDGLTKPQITQKDSLDDIIRARNGAFIGLATDF